MTEQQKKFMREAIRLSQKGMENNEGGPFGCVVVRNSVIVGRGNNHVTSTNDPTAHAEVMAIRDACRNLSAYELIDCELYASCEPCPMCLGAIYWSKRQKRNATNHIVAVEPDVSRTLPMHVAKPISNNPAIISTIQFIAVVYGF